MLESLEHLCIKIFYGNVRPFSLARLVFMTFKAYCNYHAYLIPIKTLKKLSWKIHSHSLLDSAVLPITVQTMTQNVCFYLMTSFIHLLKRPVLFSFIIFQLWA